MNALSSRTFALATTLLLGLSIPAFAVDPVKPPEPAAAPGPTVSVVTATAGEVAEQIVVTGSLIAREEVQVNPEVEGLGVSEILVEEGDHVSKGQVLAKLNHTSLDVQLAQLAAQIAQADAAIAQAQAQVAQAKANQIMAARALERASTLHNRGFGTVEILDQAQATATVDDAQVESAIKSVESALANRKAVEAQRDQILWKVSRTEIRSPAEGIISVRNTRLGQIASGIAGTPPMFKIIQNSDIELEAEVADISLPRIAKGMAVAVLPAGMIDPVPGTVRLISPEIDKATRLGHVRVILKHDDRLAVGASARGTIEVGRRTGVTLPLSAVSYDKSGAYAQVVKDNIVRTQRLTIGLLSNKSAEVLSGLEAGDLVIARAGTFVRDGDKVHPAPAPLQEATQ
jgi:HlyD family secretion protein